jgi:phosphomannomutase
MVRSGRRRLTKRAAELLLSQVEEAGDDPAGVRQALATAGVPPARLDVDLDELFELVAALNETRLVPIDPELETAARAWLADDPDPETSAELAALLESGDADAIEDRFRERLGFGTAGIRGEMGAGPNRVNVTMVRAAVAGVATWLTEPERGVVLGRDGRRRSEQLAQEAARVLSGAGVPVHVLPGMVPTPVLAFAITHLAAAGGLMITASHNPPNDNGVKVYGDDGAQIVSPADEQIAAAIERVGSVRDLPMSDDLVRDLGDEVLDAYIDAAATIVGPGPRDVRVVHTAMHGVGWEPLRRLFLAAGFSQPVAVWEQAHPDGDFPTVSFPNPEEPGALDRALAVARTAGADVVLANDPDADRLGVAIRESRGGLASPQTRWRQLSGDEIGVLLADHVLATTSGADRLVACSLVSSSMLGRIAAAHGVHFATTLTGFKWIVRATDQVAGSRFAFGYEEALGYAVGDLVRDKDGLTAALSFADLTARLKAAGETVATKLENLAHAHGLHATRQVSLRRPVVDIRAAVDRLMASPPDELDGRALQSVERPADDILVLHLDGHARVIVRPSGTEPKLKTYLQLVVDDFDDYVVANTQAAEDLDRLWRATESTLGL